MMLLCKIIFQLNVYFYKPVNSGKRKADSIMGSTARQDLIVLGLYIDKSIHVFT
jgi:ribosomal protein S6E (S10)